MNQRLSTLVVAAAAVLTSSALMGGVLGGCTTSDGAVELPNEPAVASPSASTYRFTMISLGDGERYALVAPLPVGRRADVTVSLSSLGETIDVQLEAVVARAGADGESQLIELVVVGVEADDSATVDGLLPIVGASSTLVRDERLSIVEQQLDVPTGLAFRADAVVRQALRAPFGLVGPMALEPVGAGASWSVETSEGNATIDASTVEVVSSTADGFQLRFEVSDGLVELKGRSGMLLPDEQVITLDNATLTVVAEHSN